jgi:putative membrane protein
MHTLRRALLTLLINACAVAIAALLLPGIYYTGGVKSLFLIAIVFGAINLLVKPVLSLFSLPVEIATVAILSVVVNAIMLLVIAHNVQGFHILSFPFPGFVYQHFFVPPVMIPAWGTALLGAFIIGGLITFLTWLTQNKAKK